MEYFARRFSLVWLLFSIICCVSYAQNINAPSCSISDVSAALNSVKQSAATVNIPAGTCTWTSGILYTVPAGTTSLTIQGAGAESATTGGASITGRDQTIIYDGYNNSEPLLRITASSEQFVRITGVAILQTASTPAVKSNGMVTFVGTSKAIRVDHSHFYSYISGNKDIQVYVFGGVADHDFFDSRSGTVTNDLAIYNGAGWQGLNDPDGNGNASWAVADNFGTNQFFFGEDDLFNNGWVGDCSVGGRFVLRHSTATAASAFEGHGTALGLYRGCRAAELYQNNFNDGAGNLFSGGIEASNGGVFLVWGNTIVGYEAAISLAIIRQTNHYPQLPPPNGWGNCGTAQSGVNSIWDGDFNPTTGYPCLDAPGRGAGDLITGSAFSNATDSVTGTRTWPHQALDPIYVWDNNYIPPGTTHDAIIGDQTGGNLADNRDYYQQFGTAGESGSWNGTKGINQSGSPPSGNCTAGVDPKTGHTAPGVGWWDTSNSTLYVCNPTNTWAAYYTPYTYPHPLTQSTGTGSTRPSPPSGLTAVVQ